jgi:hypothetical protein
MLSSVYVEDIFLDFYSHFLNTNLPVQPQDFSPISSFANKLIDNEQLTQNQANYVVKILDKYKTISANSGLDYRQALTNIQWRTSFRVLDLSKKIYVEKTDQGKVWVCLKFPYQLKKEFETEIDSGYVGTERASSWDSEAKVRRLALYEYNLISLYEFAHKHNFEIDDSFLVALAEVEEIWQNSEKIAPFSTALGNVVALGNASEEVQAFWDTKAIGTYENNLLLAKSMGFVLREIPKTPIEKIAASYENSFWVKNNAELFSLYKNINGRVCVILDRTGNTLQWLQRFVADADQAGVSRDDIKVCFRDSKENNSGINEWIKMAGVGGKVETGKILIFEYKPAKWLFKDVEDVKMLVTNNLYPPTNGITKDWFSSHPCVIYLGDIKPSEQRGQKIVEL